ncbi:L-cystine transporter-like protein [Westerdykella ornata]|uniref:L-cystine transporter-like protein n=1 Tax=Westerdykella ornata TaxID=318751 RepID=A0A6A6JH63_WESOR|nr:L-cystine transporter-like protein [Westerdykella ornata]KAF2274976.1 L-cystine transporter-like protein [Westerdykella ornata]
MSEKESEFVFFAKAVSRILGWAYFFCWSASFYPQPISNWQHKSTIGLAIDFPTLNVLGFIAYTISTAAFYYSPTIQSQYAYRHPESPLTTVRFNDVLFAAHGALLCVIIYSQFFPSVWGFKVSKLQKTSKAVLGIFWGSIIGILATVCMVRIAGRQGGYDPSAWAWVDVIYALGYVKLLTVVVKYMPQAYLNFQRKSTQGWSIYPMLLDFAGGVASLLQLFIDSSLQGSWEGVTGNPVKFGLGNVTLFFDVVFFYQHYVLYRDEEREEEMLRESLL